MDYRKRLTHARKDKSGYSSTCKKDELTQRLGEYEDTGLSPEEAKAFNKADNVVSVDFDSFLVELKEALTKYEENCVNPPSYTGKMCFIMEVLTITADNPIKELAFTAGEIKKALNLAKEKSA